MRKISIFFIVILSFCATDASVRYFWESHLTTQMERTTKIQKSHLWSLTPANSSRPIIISLRFGLQYY